MSILGIIGLSITELLGDASLKEYANGNGKFYLGIGVLGYIGVIILLIINLQGSTILLVNNAWDGTSSLIGSAYAYAILGERFDNYLQYVGAIFIMFGLYFLKIPLKRSHPFYIP